MDKKCPVHWGDNNALTEEELDDCPEIPEFLAYLDCDHKNTIAFKKENPVKICKKHADYARNFSGVCGCSWVILPLTVDVIASGFEWICPNCEFIHRDIEITSSLHCSRCNIDFERGEVHHAYE